MRRASDYGLNATVVLEPPYSTSTATNLDLAWTGHRVRHQAAMREHPSSAHRRRSRQSFVFLAPRRRGDSTIRCDNRSTKAHSSRTRQLRTETRPAKSTAARTRARVSPTFLSLVQAVRQRHARPSSSPPSSLRSTSLVEGYSISSERPRDRQSSTSRAGQLIFSAPSFRRDVSTRRAELSDNAASPLGIRVDTDFIFDVPGVGRDHILTSMLSDSMSLERVFAAHEARTLVPGLLHLALADDAVATHVR